MIWLFAISDWEAKVLPKSFTIQDLPSVLYSAACLYTGLMNRGFITRKKVTTASITAKAAMPIPMDLFIRLVFCAL